MHSVNFGRWLERLGLKSAAEPEFASTVVPVSIVADQRMLVAPTLGPSYAVGGIQGGLVVLDGPALLVVTNVPLWVRMRTDAVGTNSTDHQIEIGQPGAGPPALNTPTVLTPQLFRGPASAVWSVGTLPRPAAPTLPAWKATVNGTFPLDWVHIPAGGWGLWFRTVVGTNQTYYYAVVYEMPNERAQ